MRVDSSARMAHKDEPGQPDLGESQHICSRKVRQMQRKKIKESN